MIRRILRRLFTAVLTVSGAAALLLSVAAACFWARGYWVADVWDAVDAHDGITDDHWRSLRLTTGRGVVIVMYAHRHTTHPPTRTPTTMSRDAGGRVTIRELPPVPREESRGRYIRRIPMDPRQINLLNRTAWQKMGFNAWSKTTRADYPAMGPTQTYSWTVRAPHWAIVLACAPAGILWLRAVTRRVIGARRRRRARRGLCPRCAYDIRASQGRCPECGEPLAQ